MTRHTLYPMVRSTMVYVADGYTCPTCQSVHFVAVNQGGRTYCPQCLPGEVDHDGPRQTGL